MKAPKKLLDRFKHLDPARVSNLFENAFKAQESRHKEDLSPAEFNTMLAEYTAIQQLDHDTIAIIRYGRMCGIKYMRTKLYKYLHND